MADTMTPLQRSRCMRSIREKNTKPEWLVRRLLHSQGLRYRLHDKSLPGKPDLVFSRKRVAIFVHGCFWHLHEGCREGRIPASRTEYWRPKLERNVERDKLHYAELERRGWRIITIWECETKDLEALEEKLILELRD